MCLCVSCGAFVVLVVLLVGVEGSMDSCGPGPESSSLLQRDHIRTHIRAAAIKKVMRADDAVGKIAKVTPAAIAAAAEVFLLDLLEACAQRATLAGARTITPQHIKEAVEHDSTGHLGILEHIVERIGAGGKS